MFLILCMLSFFYLMNSSSLRKKFMETREQTKQTLNLDVYNNFLNELHTNERDQSVVKYCFFICFIKHIK